MHIVRYPDPATWPELLRRPSLPAADLQATVHEVFAAVQSGGDGALLNYTERFDRVRPVPLVNGPAEFAAAEDQLPLELKSALQHAAQNIRTFHATQAYAPTVIETQPGIRCWRRATPIHRVGLYVPGGTAPLFSTLLMLAVPAAVAGCREITVVTPPQATGQVHPAMLYAAQLAGAHRVVAAGGIQAIAALTYGTESIAPVDKLFGPGNQYVTAAKQYAAQLGVAIDLPAGPSEVAVLADASADPDFVAADLLSQAEHGTDSQVLLITTHQPLLAAVSAALERQLPALPRHALAAAALANSRAVLVRTPDELLALSEAYAPEHLILHLSGAEAFAERIETAGSVFVGPLTPESLGDYASGTNHTLPTAGFARAYSGVSLSSFQKHITFQQATRAGLAALGPVVETLAHAEALAGHANAVRIRLEKEGL